MPTAQPSAQPVAERRAAESELRSLIAGVRDQINKTSSLATTDELRSNASALGGSFAALEKFMNLGPFPDLRDCPRCGQMGMAKASVCGHCWVKLAPVEA